MRSAIVLALVTLLAAPALAQQVDIEKPAPAVRERGPAPEPEILTPGLADETRPHDAIHHPSGGRVPYEPAFIRGLSAKRVTPTSTGRMGIAGWTSPTTPIGNPWTTGWGGSSGSFGFGFAVTWDGPPPAAKRPAN
jgi:hypothetical protein